MAAPEQNAKQLLDVARAEMANNNFPTARRLLETVLQMRPRDEYVVQQLALATYKSKEPDARSALIAARELLRQLDPDVTNDPETLGLWGAVHKRLWDIDQDRSYLDAAIGAYERGFYLKQDYYNGINLAFLLNVRAAVHHASGDKSEAVADFVVARRVRREVIRYCERALAIATDPAARYWVIATLWEAALGLGDPDTAARWQKEAEAVAPGALDARDDAQSARSSQSASCRVGLGDRVTQPAATTTVVAVAGRRIDAPDAGVTRFPLHNRDRVRQLIASVLRSQSVSAVISSGACGADLLALDVARRAASADA